MRELFLILDFFCPVFFLILGFNFPRKRIGRKLVSEGLAVFVLALLFAPICYRWFSLEVQGFLCAMLLFVQFFLVACRLYSREQVVKN